MTDGSLPTEGSDALPPPPLQDKLPSTVKRKEVRRQLNVLEDLLHEPVPSVCDNADQYARLRCRYAMLRAFQRKLSRLQDEAKTLCDRAHSVIELIERDCPHTDSLSLIVQGKKMNTSSPFLQGWRSEQGLREREREG